MYTPFTAFIHYAFNGSKVSFSIFFSMVLITCGVLIGTLYDASWTKVGLIYSTSATIVTSVYHLYVARSKTDFALSPMELLYAQTPLAALGILVLIPVFDDYTSLYAYTWSYTAVRDIVVSCFLALLLNYTAFATIGKTTPLKLSLIGHFKTCCVFIAGYALFDSRASVSSVAGIVLTLIGVGLYSVLKLQ